MEHRWKPGQGGNPKGQPNGVRARSPLEDRFWSKVDKDGPGGCWLWTGARRLGYGVIGAGGDRGKTLLAHRVAFKILVGPTPDGKELDHLCRVRHCVNPQHLEAVTHQENVRRGDTLSMGAPRRAITHCPIGHEYSESNTYRYPDGRRKCRICGRSADQTRRAKLPQRPRNEEARGLFNRSKTNCPNGHPYEDWNTYKPSSGWRQCKTCRRLNQKRYRDSTARAIELASLT